MTRDQFAVRVRELRERRKLTQAELAELSDLSADTIYKLEHASFSPSLETLTKLAAGVGLTIPHLMNDNFDEADDLAALIRALPTVERHVALVVLGSLCAHVAASRGQAVTP